MEAEYLAKIASSYKFFTGKDLIDKLENLFTADFVCASHRFYKDAAPKFVFANQKALDLWEIKIEDFIGMPSSYTAEKELQIERQNLLDQVKTLGFINNYSGIRISSKGKKFEIINALVWNVINDNGDTLGQAVKFDDYRML